MIELSDAEINLLRLKFSELNIGKCEACGKFDKLIWHHWYEYINSKEVCASKDVCMSCNASLNLKNMYSYLLVNKIPVYDKNGIDIITHVSLMNLSEKKRNNYLTYTYFHVMPSWENQVIFRMECSYNNVSKVIQPSLDKFYDLIGSHFMKSLNIKERRNIHLDTLELNQPNESFVQDADKIQILREIYNYNRGYFKGL